MSFVVPSSEVTELTVKLVQEKMKRATVTAQVMGVIEALESFSNEITREEAARRLRKAIEE